MPPDNGGFELLGQQPIGKPGVSITVHPLGKEPPPPPDAPQPASPQPPVQSGTGGDGGFSVLHEQPADPTMAQQLLRKGQDILVKQDEDIDYKTGAPTVVRSELQGAANANESYKVLDRLYGKNNFGQDRFGQWWVKQDGKRIAVLPHGLSGAFKNMLSSLQANPWTTGGAMLGSALGGTAGSVVPFAGTTAGIVTGGMIGAAVGRGLDDLQHWVMGTFAKKPTEVAGSMMQEAAIAGGFQMAGPALRATGRGVKRGIQSFLGTRETVKDFTRGPGGALVPRSFSRIRPESKFGREMAAGSPSGLEATYPGRGSRTINPNDLPKAVPPIGSYAPGATSAERRRQLRDILAGPGGTKAEQKNITYLNARMRGILSQEGFSTGEINVLMNEIRDKSSELSNVPSGRAVVRAAVRQHSTEVGEFNQAREIALRQLRREQRALEQFARAPEGLSEVVADAIVHKRRQFGRQMADVYKEVDRIAGDQPMVPTAVVQAAAREIMATMPESSVPPFVKMAATGRFTADALGQEAAPAAAAGAARPPGAADQLSAIRQQMQGMGLFEEQEAAAAPLRGLESETHDEPQHFITFQQAHAMRTWLREKGEIPDLAAQGIGGYNWRKMAGAVNHAIDDSEGTLGQQAAAALKQADTLYREGIRQYNHKLLNQLVRDVEHGLIPDPKVTAARIMDPDNINAARHVINMLPQAAKAGVFQADLENMLNQATHMTVDGQFMLDGRSLLMLMHQRGKLLDAVYPAPFLRSLRRLAAEQAAYDGQIDISALVHSTPTPSNVMNLLEQSVASHRNAELFVQRNPLGALVNGTPEQIDAAVLKIMQPGREERTVEAARTLGSDSHAWKQIQRYALQRVLAGSFTRESRSLQTTIAGEMIDKQLSRFTPRQQELLFPAGLANDLRVLAKEAKYLFPRGGSADTGTSLAAAAIQQHFPWWPPAVIRWAHVMMSGWMSDHPRVLRWLTDEVKADPKRARGIMNVLGQWIWQRSLSPGPGNKQPDMEQGSMLGAKPSKDQSQAPGYGGE